MAELPGTEGTAQAIRLQQALVRRTPRDAHAWAELARLFVLHARRIEDPSFYAQADDAVRHARQVAPDDMEAGELQALLLLQNHDFRGARDRARELILRMHPPRPDIYGILSDALMELGDYPESIEAADHMVDLRPDSQSYVRVAWLRYLHGDVDGALEVMRLALDALPTQPEARAWIVAQLGVLYWNRGDLDNAQRYFDAASREHAGSSAAHAGRARIALARGDSATALREATAAVQANPIAENDWLAGDAATAAGHADEAARFFEALARTGERTDPRTLSLFDSTRDREPAQALALAQREHENRADVFTEDALAWALYRNHRLAEATASMALARRIATPDARMLYHDGMIRHARGDEAGAATSLRAALATNAYWDRTEADEARRVLATLPAPPG